MKCLGVLLVIFAAVNISFGNDYVINNKTFPDTFSFGCATSAFQREGGWDEDGKGPSLWDTLVHTTPSIVSDNSTADVACDSYHKYETDVAMLKYLGVSHYRFSISWPRILPTGLPDSFNQAGVKYYKNLIQLLKDNNIIPLVTLYHWDIPQTLQDQGGILSGNFMGWFGDYARICFQQFGDDVQYWATFNEAVVICKIASMGQPVESYNEYECAHNILRAHATAYHIYDDEFRTTQGGYISMVHAISWFGPGTNATEDILASERKMQFDLGWWANPIYHGDYPDIMKDRASQRLPVFTDEEKAFLINTSDFFCINTYGSQLVRNHPYIVNLPDRQHEEAVDILNNTNYPDGAWGMLPMARWVQSHYNNPAIIMTENGLGVDAPDDSLEDDNRLSLVQNYLSAIRDAIDENINFVGYTLWSLMDNFEWTFGYSRKYGIYHVNFESDNRTRTPRKSAEWYKNVISTRCLVDNCVE